MRSEDRRVARRRTYSLVAMLLVMVILIITLSAFLRVGQTRIEVQVYSNPKQTLRVLARAEERYRGLDPDGDGVHTYAGSLDELEQGACITRRLASGEVGDPPYRYEVVRADEGGYAIRGAPATPGPRSLYFYMDQTEIIRAAVGTPAGETSEIYYHPFRGYEWPGSERP